jgi:lycopene cyclase domain-containing protein
MSHLVYLALLAACVVGTAPLEFLLRVRVYRRWRRLLAAIVPTMLVFGAWDIYAIGRQAWSYNSRYVVGVTLPGGLPLEECLFFLVIPTCAISTLEAVRRRRPQWIIGDETPDLDNSTAGEL